MLLRKLALDRPEPLVRKGIDRQANLLPFLYESDGRAGHGQFRAQHRVRRHEGHQRRLRIGRLTEPRRQRRHASRNGCAQDIGSRPRRARRLLSDLSASGGKARALNLCLSDNLRMSAFGFLQGGSLGDERLRQLRQALPPGEQGFLANLKVALADEAACGDAAGAVIVLLR